MFIKLYKNSLLLAALLFSPLQYALVQSPESTAINIEYSEGLISMDSSELPLNQILRALEEQTGITSIYLVDVEQLPRIKASLVDVSLDECIDYLLRGINHMILYDSNGLGSAYRFPKQIWILGSDFKQEKVSFVEGTEFHEQSDKQRSEILLQLVGQKAMPQSDLIKNLTKSLRSDHSALVRTRAAIGLAQLRDESAVPVLIAALTDQSTSVRNQAILALGEIANEAAIDALGAILQENSNPQERNLAVRALSSHKTDQAIKYLELAGFDVDEQVRESSILKNNFNSTRPNKDGEWLE